MGRPAAPEEIANVIRFLSSGEVRYITGGAIPADGGVTAWAGQPIFLNRTLLPF